MQTKRCLRDLTTKLEGVKRPSAEWSKIPYTNWSAFNYHRSDTTRKSNHIPTDWRQTWSSRQCTPSRTRALPVACVYGISSRTLCPRRTSMGFTIMCARPAAYVYVFRIMRQVFGVCLWDLESSFRPTLPWQRDLYMHVLKCIALDDPCEPAG